MRAYARRAREREVTARCGGRACLLPRAARHNSDVTVAAALRGGNTEGVCLYTAGMGVLDRGVALDRATQCAWACRLRGMRQGSWRLDGPHVGSTRKEEAETLARKGDDAVEER
jgi:hypothetical protein